MKRFTLLSILVVLLTNLIYSQSVDVKDSDGHSLIKINDEGNTGGSITIPDATSVGIPTDKLYNESGTLKWNGTALGTGGDWANGGNSFGANSMLGNNDSYDLGFETNATTRMTIRSNGNVGIGISSPISKLSVGGSGDSDVTIFGNTNLSSGIAVGGFAGERENVTNYGGYFEAQGWSGRGVFGHASNINGLTSYGGYFESKGTTGRGVYGEASYTGSGINHGGYFIARSSNGKGVFAESTGNNGLGVHGSVSGDNAYGIYGSASGSNGRAVHGYATNSAEVTNYGGNFVANGAYGRGVYGKATRFGSYVNYGGYFEAAGTAGRGVYGYASALNGVTNYGGFFKTEGDYGRGVYGEANSTASATNYGGYFKAKGTNGMGVYGVASATSGQNYGVYGKTMSSSGWAGYFDGRGYFSNMVGIGTTTPQATLHVKDIIMIEPGKQPTSSQEGMIYYDGTTHKLRVYNGTAWINLH